MRQGRSDVLDVLFHGLADVLQVLFADPGNPNQCGGFAVKLQCLIGVGETIKLIESGLAGELASA